MRARGNFSCLASSTCVTRLPLPAMQAWCAGQGRVRRPWRRRSSGLRGRWRRPARISPATQTGLRAPWTCMARSSPRSLTPLSRHPLPPLMRSPCKHRCLTRSPCPTQMKRSGVSCTSPCRSATRRRISLSPSPCGRSISQMSNTSRDWRKPTKSSSKNGKRASLL